MGRTAPSSWQPWSCQTSQSHSGGLLTSSMALRVSVGSLQRELRNGSWANSTAHVSAFPNALQPTASPILQMCRGRTSLREKQQTQQRMATSSERRPQRCWVSLEFSLANVSSRSFQCRCRLMGAHELIRISEVTPVWVAAATAHFEDHHSL